MPSGSHEQTNTGKDQMLFNVLDADDLLVAAAPRRETRLSCNELIDFANSDALQVTTSDQISSPNRRLVVWLANFPGLSF